MTVAEFDCTIGRGIAAAAAERTSSLDAPNTLGTMSTESTAMDSFIAA
eukprot:CAMPEP_0182588478 /NCGR_PEP_ID=MMETSP1324-20130603/67316_1 /TAXON_ID=236786 /ORGANISM="Florenciella sp., Strain RCC1587" /LENGTH=47 /DNA_ID= /DNA_START= /DNA_END= /DNA_ORIENTATION=